MLEHYLENARRTIFFAKYEAIELRSPDICPEHLLLGLLSSEPVAIGITNDIAAREIRDEIVSYLRRHEKQSRATLIFSDESLEALAAAREEAKSIGHRFVNNYHIALGLLRVKDSFAAQVLGRNGTSGEYVRRQMPISGKEDNAESSTSHESAPVSGQFEADRGLYELEKRVLEFVRLNDHEAALNLVDTALADPSLDRSQVIRSLIPIASVIARLRGDFDLARRYCEQRIASEPDNAMALYQLADCLAAQGKAEAAKKFALQSYKLSLQQGTPHSQSSAELVERRFPELKMERHESDD